MHRAKLLITTALATIPLASSLLASAVGLEMVNNGDFQSGLTGWHVSPNDPAKLKAEVVNGAAELTNLYTGTGSSYYGMDQCLASAEAGKIYEISAEVLIPAGQTPAGHAWLQFRFNKLDNCQGGTAFTPDAFDKDYVDFKLGFPNHPEHYGTWVHLVDYVVAPPLTTALEVEVEAIKEPGSGNSAGPFKIRVDNVSVRETDKLPEPEEPEAPQEPEDPGQPEGEDETPFPVLQDPIDIVIPGPLGSASDPVKPSEPSLPEQPLQPAKPATPSQPSQPAEPKADPLSETPQADHQSTQPEASAAIADQSAPLPPSTGTGIATPGGSTPLAGIATALIAIATATLAFATRRSR